MIIKKPLGNIVYLEDEPHIAKLAKLSLERINGFNVVTCLTAQSLFDYLNESKPDLIMLDVMMPIMDGPVVLSILRGTAGLSSIPVIFMTAKIQPHEAKEYMSMGVIGIVAKPFDPLTLGQSIQEIWDQHHESN